MKTMIHHASFCALVLTLLCSHAFAAKPETLLAAFDTPAPVAFAASEIRRACATRSMQLIELDLTHGLESPHPLRLFIAATPQERAKLIERFNLFPPRYTTPQSYAIRRIIINNQTSLIVLGADPVGAMYGGLDLAEAIRHLESALEHWKRYAAAYTQQYKQPILYNRVGFVDIPKLTDQVAADITIARDWKPGLYTNAPRPRPGEDRPFRP